jgi:hypothetical protein
MTDDQIIEEVLREYAQKERNTALKDIENEIASLRATMTVPEAKKLKAAMSGQKTGDITEYIRCCREVTEIVRIKK